MIRDSLDLKWGIKAFHKVTAELCNKSLLMLPLEIKFQNLYARNKLEMYPEFEIVRHNKQPNTFNY